MQMTVTWTSGYNINEALPLVEWGLKGQIQTQTQTQTQTPAQTMTFHRNSMCGNLSSWSILVYSFSLSIMFSDGFIW